MLRRTLTLCFALGLVVALAACSTGPKLTEEEAEILSIRYPEEAEVILMMDYSMGMMAHDKQDERLRAAQAFVDMLSDDNHLALMSYSTQVDYLTEDFLHLAEQANREQVKELLGAIESKPDWKNVSEALMDVKYYYDESFNRDLIAKRETIRAEGNRLPSRRRHMVIIFDGDRHLDLHSEEAVAKRYEDGTYNYFIMKLREIEQRGFQVHSIALTEKASNHFTRLIAAETGGSFYIAEDADDIIDAYANIVAEIDGLMEVTSEPLELGDEARTVQLPCIGERAAMFLAYADDDEVEPLNEQATFGENDVSLIEPKEGLRVNRGPGYTVVNPYVAECGDYTFNGPEGRLRAWIETPYLVKHDQFLNRYIVDAEARFKPEFFDRDTKMTITDPAMQQKIDVSATFTSPTGTETEVDLKPVIPAEGEVAAFAFEGTYKVPEEFGKAKKGRLSKSERMHTKDEDTRVAIDIDYKVDGRTFTRSFNRIFRVVDAPLMVFDESEHPESVPFGENYTFQVHFEEDGEMIVDKEFSRATEIRLELEHLPTERSIRGEIADGGGSGDKQRLDGIFTREVRLKTEFKRNQLPEEEQPGRYRYTIESKIIHKGAAVTQIKEGTFTVEPPPEPEV